MTDAECFHDRVRLERSHDAKVAWLVVERGGGPMNAFGPPVVDAMTEAVEAAEAAAPAVGCLVVRGEGEFSVGADLRTFHEAATAEERATAIDATVAASNRFVRAVRGLEIPVIAAVTGVAAGGGLGFALACDLVAMHEDAVLDTAYARVGLTPDNGVPYFLALAVGPYRARDLLLDPEPVAADEALDLGLASSVHAGDEATFLDAVGEKAARLASGHGVARARTKRLVDSAFEVGLDEHLDRERETIRETGRTDAVEEGLAAFFEGREPEWN